MKSHGNNRYPYVVCEGKKPTDRSRGGKSNVNNIIIPEDDTVFFKDIMTYEYHFIIHESKPIKTSDLARAARDDDDTRRRDATKITCSIKKTIIDAS